MNHRATFRYLLSLIALLSGLLSGSATAALLTFTPSATSFTVSPGGTVTVQGDIVNRTINSLSSTDLILNFNDYDPAVITPFQRLGEGEFVIPSFSFISNVPAFDLNISASAANGVFTTLVTLQDIYGNLSDAIEFNVIVDGGNQPAPIPLPATPALFAIGVVLLSLTRMRIK